MFDIEIAADTLPHGLAPDQLEQDLITIESTIGRLRARQLRLLRRVDLAQIAARDGSRSLHEWTAARLDITAKLAADLVTASRTIPDDLDNKLTVGEMSFDRAVATSHLVVAGASERLVDDSAGFNLADAGTPGGPAPGHDTQRRGRGVRFPPRRHPAQLGPDVGQRMGHFDWCRF